MKRIKSILCVVDPNQESVSAIERVSLLAQRNGSKLRVLGVVESIPAGTMGGTSFPSVDVRDLILGEAKAEIEQLVGAADTHGVSVQTHLLGERVLRRRSSRDSIEQWTKQAEAAHRNELDRLLEHAELGDLDFERHLIKGMPRDVLSSFAADNEIDLVLMGTVCRTGIAGLFIGNTAEFVVEQVDCPVLAVKPDGFVSPIAV